ncbi:MAG TPA: hypothetical protein VGQ42_15870 [Candidatus Dormibacteraeota bacterium]|jgi:hypothetical protein|nr:hypothetical protein [Candidatus Dormibacteraeota bacterium]
MSSPHTSPPRRRRTPSRHPEPLAPPQDDATTELAGVAARATPGNSSFHFVHRHGGWSAYLRIVLRGPCTLEHRERIERALSGGRGFLPALVAMPGVPARGADARPRCEFVALHPTTAAPTDPRSVESFVIELEAAAMHGWNDRPPARLPAV